MTPTLSPNTQAILLLTAPLIAGRGTSKWDLLSPSEYKSLARHLRDINRQPADLLSQDATTVLETCRPIVDESRMKRLLGRGFLLSQVIEHWKTRAIWVVSRADSDYPRRLKVQLREDAPALIYGVGDIGLLDSGGIAVVGSRHADDSLIDYTLAVGQLAARARVTLVSGGAKGIDQAAMRGALEAGGNACGVLSDSLEKAALQREHRNLLIDGQLVLVSPYDPSAGFNVGNAMQRNKLIYAFAEASLVVSSDVNKGGTWAGAVEQLDKLRLVPVFVRSTGQVSEGLNALREKGAIPWPNPQNTDDFKAVFSTTALQNPGQIQTELSLAANELPASTGLNSTQPASGDAVSPNKRSEKLLESPTPIHSDAHSRQLKEQSTSAAHETQAKSAIESAREHSEASPADCLFATVSNEIQRLLKAPMKDADIATALGVSTSQAKAWLQRLVDEGVLERRKKPFGYIVKQTQLFE